MASQRPHGGTTVPSGAREGRGAILAVLLVLALAVAVRVRLADVPLERDEGEYAYAGQLILDGIPPYELAYNMKFPGTYYAYAAILAVLGQSPRGVHLGLLVVNAATVLALYALGRRLLGGFAGAVAGGAFALLSLDRAVAGPFAHATHFVVLPAVLGLLVLERSLDSRRAAGFLGGGVLLGVAVLMKQHAVFFVPLGVGLVAWNAVRERPRDAKGTALRLALLGGGVALPLALLAAWFAAHGVLGRFWFWTFDYAREYVSEVPLSRGLPKLVSALGAVTRVAWPAWAAAGIGMIVLWTPAWTPRARAFLVGLAATSFLATCPGFFFRSHYFIVMLPAVALLAGVAAASADRALAKLASPSAARAAVWGALALAAAGYVVAERGYLFTMSPIELSRQVYGGNPFVESVEIGRYIRERTSPDDRIAVLGSEPQIYFYAGRRSATGYIYTYALMEPQRFAARMQDEMIREIETARPKYVVFVEIVSSWLARDASDRRILTWGRRYLSENYDLAGLADVLPNGATRMRWDGDVRGYEPVSTSRVYTFRRKD